MVIFLSNTKCKFVYVVTVRFAGKAKEMLNLPRYHEFKRRLIMSIDSCKERDFNDQTMSFSHTCYKPTDVFEYFYALNPMPGDDILDDAEVAIIRREISAAAKVSNKTAPITKEVKTHDKVKERGVRSSEE